MCNKKKVLYLTTVLPLYPKSGGEIATCNFIDKFNQLGYEIDVVGYIRETVDLPTGFISVGVREIETSFRKLMFWVWMFQSFIYMRPYSSQKFFSKKYLRTVSSLLDSGSYSAVVVEHSQLYWLTPLLTKFKGKLKLIFSSQNVEFRLYTDLAKAARGKKFILKPVYMRESRLMKRSESMLISSVDEVWCLTDADKDGYKHYFGEKDYKTFPLIGSVNRSLQDCNMQTFRKDFDIVILGTWTWQPNNAGLLWFFEYVYPLLNNDLKIGVAGKGAEWLTSYYDNVTYLGFVDSAYAFLQSGKCIVIPSTEGGGIQIKTIDAIRAGCQIVTTSVGVRGLDDLPEGVAVVDEPKEFADKIISVVESTEINFINKHTNWLLARERAFEQLIASMN